MNHVTGLPETVIPLDATPMVRNVIAMPPVSTKART